MAPSSTSAVLLGSAAFLVAAAAASKIYTPLSTSRALTDIEELDEDYITEDDVCKIFQKLFLEMQQVVAAVSQQIQMAQMSTGQMIPEARIRMALIGEFQRNLPMIQKKVFDEFDVDEECLQEATWEFMAEEHPKVKVAVERFQRLWENISGEKVVGKRPGKEEKEEEIEILTAEQVTEAAEVYFQALTDTMRSLVTSLKKEGKDLQSRMVVQELHMKFSTEANDKGAEALKKIDVSFDQFQKSMETHASNPAVGRRLAELQKNQQMEMMAMGVPM